MLLATRYKLATLAPEILAFDAPPWVEQIIAYVGITVTRLIIYLIHRLGECVACTDLATLAKQACIGPHHTCS